MAHTRQFLIVDDHPLYLEALEAAVKQGFEDAEIELAETIEDAELFLAKNPRTEVVLLDLRMPGKSDFDGLKQIKGTCPHLPVIVISSLKDEDIVEHSRLIGASGFISKSARGQDIIASLNNVLKGGTCFPDQSTGTASDAWQPSEEQEFIARIRELTPQQFRVLQLICKGKMNKQIAFELGVGATTVKAHISSMLKKLGVHSRTQAALMVQRIKLHEVRLEWKADAQ